jgi:hypothetical protein
MTFFLCVTQNGKYTEIINELDGKCVSKLRGYQFHRLLYRAAQK